MQANGSFSLSSSLLFVFVAGSDHVLVVFMGSKQTASNPLLLYSTLVSNTPLTMAMHIPGTSSLPHELPNSPSHTVHNSVVFYSKRKGGGGGSK